MQQTQTIKIFLGSSITELKNAREEITAHITNDITNLFGLGNIAIQFVVCEDTHSDYMGGMTDQDKIDNLLRSCDVSVFLIKEKAGDQTVHEYDVAKELQKEKQELKGLVAVCCAGTADLYVAEECAKTAEFFGAKAERIYDVGVSGIHRLFARLDVIRAANCVVAIAGMEGALASVIGGLVTNPVIAVPTSVGYGASFGGLSALLTMINSCANGVATVNIDNGYGAGYLATQINRLAIKND